MDEEVEKLMHGLEIKKGKSRLNQLLPNSFIGWDLVMNSIIRSQN